MKRYSTIYYLLFVLIIMGAFASMAQNAYGLKICGIACLGFALTFLNEILFSVHLKDEQLVPTWIVYGELIFLFIIALVYFLRNFSIDFPFTSTLLIISSVGLLFMFIYQAILQIRMARLQHIKLAVALALYYGSVIAFILSFLASILLPDITNKLVALAMLITAGLLGFVFIFKKVSFNDETISFWQYIGQLRNKSAILLVTCILIYGYNLLYLAGTLPPLYRGTLPEGYQHLVELSTTSKDQKKPIEFKTRYEEFLRKYDKN